MVGKPCLACISMSLQRSATGPSGTARTKRPMTTAAISALLMNARSDVPAGGSARRPVIQTMARPE